MSCEAKQRNQDLGFRSINIKMVYAHAKTSCCQTAKSYSTSIFLKPQTKENLEVCVSTILGTNLTRKHANNDIKWEETECET